MRILALKAGHLIADGASEVFMIAAELQEVYDVGMGVFPHRISGTAIACFHD